METEPTTLSQQQQQQQQQQPPSLSPLPSSPSPNASGVVPLTPPTVLAPSAPTPAPTPASVATPVSAPVHHTSTPGPTHTHTHIHTHTHSKEEPNEKETIEKLRNALEKMNIDYMQVKLKLDETLTENNKLKHTVSASSSSSSASSNINTVNTNTSNNNNNNNNTPKFKNKLSKLKSTVKQHLSELNANLQLDDSLNFNNNNNNNNNENVSSYNNMPESTKKVKTFAEINLFSSKVNNNNNNTTTGTAVGGSATTIANNNNNNNNNNNSGSPAGITSPTGMNNTDSTNAFFSSSTGGSSLGVGNSNKYSEIKKEEEKNYENSNQDKIEMNKTQVTSPPASTTIEQQTINDLNNKLAKKKEIINKIKEKKKTMQTKIDQYYADISQLKSERDALMVKNMELGEELTDIKKQLQTLQQQDVRNEWEKIKQERDVLVNKNVEITEQNMQSIDELNRLRTQVAEYEQQQESWKKAQSEELKIKQEELEKIAEEWKKKHETDTNELRSENNALKKKNKSLQSALTLLIQQNNKQEPFSKETKGISAKSLSNDMSMSTEEKMSHHDLDVSENSTLTNNKNHHSISDMPDSNSQSKKHISKMGISSDQLFGGTTDTSETTSGSSTATNFHHSNHDNSNSNHNGKQKITSKFMNQISKTLKLNRYHSENTLGATNDEKSGMGLQNSTQIQHLVTSLSDIIREKEEIIQGLKESKHVLGLKVLKLEEELQTSHSKPTIESTATDPIASTDSQPSIDVTTTIVPVETAIITTTTTE